MSTVTLIVTYDETMLNDAYLAQVLAEVEGVEDIDVIEHQP